ncbi:unnamed protein product, partial [Iphiclides podalirius]
MINGSPESIPAPQVRGGTAQRGGRGRRDGVGRPPVRPRRRPQPQRAPERAPRTAHRTPLTSHRTTTDHHRPPPTTADHRRHRPRRPPSSIHVAILQVQEQREYRPAASAATHPCSYHDFVYARILIMDEASDLFQLKFSEE